MNIIKNTYPESFSEIPPMLDHLKALFNSVQEIIQQGLKEAKLQNKKLFLVAGEEHYTLNSLFFQLSLLQAAQQTKEINHVLAELSEKDLQQVLCHPRNNLNMDCSIPYAKRSLNMQVIPIDIFCEGGLTEETVKLRDNYMGSMALNCDNHALVFCGAAHLKAFNDNLQLKEKHHIILMDITGYSPEIRKQKIEIWQSHGGELAIKAIFPETSPEVIRLQLEGNMELFSHAEIMDWRNMHKNKYGAQPEPVSIFSSLNQLTSSFSSVLTQASTYIPSFFRSSQDNKRKRPEDEVEKNKNAGKRRRIGNRGGSHSQDE